MCLASSKANLACKMITVKTIPNGFIHFEINLLLLTHLTREYVRKQ